MNIEDKRVENKEAATYFLNNLQNNIYILGSNKYGISMGNWLTSIGKNVIGYVDDFTDKKEFNGLPVVRSLADFNSAVIINCVIEGQSVNVKKLIDKTNAEKSIDYFSLQFAFPESLLAIDYTKGTDDILKLFARYNAIYHKLSDDISKKEFEAVLNFRLNRDISFMKGFSFKLQDQYFEDFILMPAKSIFVDGGGFDGSTSLAFARHYPDYSSIFYFEPTTKSMEISTETLKNTRDVSFYQKGLWKSSETLRFNSELGNSSHITEIGGDVIEVVAIDDVVDKKVDFIKLDIEGAEKEALEGSKKIISKYRPVIAVCVYHNQNDFIQIPEYLLTLVPDYKIYFRHYTQGTCESVMYFI